MIKSDKGIVKVDGSRGTILADFVLIMKALNEYGLIDNDLVDMLFDLACKDDEELVSMVLEMVKAGCSGGLQ